MAEGGGGDGERLVMVVVMVMVMVMVAHMQDFFIVAAILKLLYLLSKVPKYLIEKGGSVQRLCEIMFQAVSVKLVLKKYLYMRAAGDMGDPQEGSKYQI